MKLGLSKLSPRILLSRAIRSSLFYTGWRGSAPVSVVVSTLTVLDKDGNSFSTSLNVLDKDGNSFTVTTSVLDKDGNSFTVI